MAKYLDKDGLSYLWSKIEERFVDNAELGDAISGANVPTKIKYDKEAKTISLMSGDSVLGESVSVDDFIKDGMLEDVSIVTAAPEGKVNYNGVDYTEGKFIKFTWNTDGGSKIDYLKVTDLAADPETDNTNVSKDITIAGGPLAELCKDTFADGKIPADMTMQKLLETLFCKEIYPTSFSTQRASLTSVIAQPTITGVSGTVEVGTKVSYSVTAGVCSCNKTANKVSGFTYGYADDVTGTGKSAATSITVDAAAPTVSNNAVNLTVNVNNTSVGDIAAGTTTALPTYSGTFNAKEGTNTVSATNQGALYTSTVAEIPAKYACSNLGNFSEDHKSSAVPANDALATASRGTSNRSASVNAYYKYFIGYNEATTVEALDSDKIRALEMSDWINPNSGYSSATGVKMTSDGRSIIVACPSTYKLSAISDGYDNDMIPKFTSTGTVEVTTGAITTTYNVYVYPITNGATVGYKNVKITKA